MTPQFPDQPQHRPARGSRYLTPEDRQQLERLEDKQQIVRDRVAGVVEHLDTGMYLYGDGGIGKSYTVERELQRRGVKYVLFNSWMTGRGLYDQLEKSPDAVHVLEDMETLFKHKAAQGVLRSALWGHPQKSATGRMERPVTWTTHGQAPQFIFTGGIIIVGNRPIDDVPELRAIKTRIASLHLEVTQPEMQALMRQVAGEGHRHGRLRLGRRACREVCEYVLEQCSSIGRPRDMRLLVKSFNDRLQWKEGHAVCHWKDLVAARVRERPTALQNPVEFASRAAEMERDREIVAEILAESDEPQEQVRLWIERTGKSEKAWYRRRREVLALGFSAPKK